MQTFRQSCFSWFNAIRGTIKKASPATIFLALLLTTFLLPVQGVCQTEPSAMFEVQSTDKGFLMPRISQAQRDVIVSPATGLIIYNLTENCLEINLGNSTSPLWVRFIIEGKVATLDCAGSTISGQLSPGQQAINVSASIPYTGGNGGFHGGQVVNSTGVLGLTALLVSGNFDYGDGSLVFTISGVPSSTGLASFVLDLGGHICSMELNVTDGNISTLDCDNATISGPLIPGVAASGVIASVPYTGGNGGSYNSQTVNSTGVSGLTATLAAGSFANGADNLDYVISGTPSNTGTASFALEIGGQACTMNLTIGCGAYIAPNAWKNFMCHNLGAANSQANPLQPSWEIAGGYWQWGRKGPDPSTWLTTNTEHFAHGPTGSGAGQANAAIISGWSQTNAPNGAWSDAAKTGDDPCPTGYRMPTKAQWDGVLANNNPNNLGPWFSSSTNFSSGCLYGTSLFLPASGSRNSSNGQLSDRGKYGYYWSSTDYGSANAWLLNFGSISAFTSTFSPSRGIGSTVRCISETAPSMLGSIGALNCGSAATTGSLMPNQTAIGVSTSVPYTGGNGGSHNGQTVYSTGVTGLTASLAPGSFSNGSGSLTYTITGIPAAAGQASFALSIGGQTCTLLVTVDGCGAYVAPGQWKAFMCHNLAAANTAADPLVPSWEINGGYWQWGHKGPSSSQWLNTNTPNFAHGPTGSGSGQANEASISGWSSTTAPNGAWSDASKTANDPCPAGFRVPTGAQWDGVTANNTQTAVGTWSASATNYSSGRFFGPGLLLPATGSRTASNGSLDSRGNSGYYWGTTELGSGNAWYLVLSSFGGSYTTNNSRLYGFSLRCIGE
ncbi:MAG: hypothetical protein RI973_434 [Bacteroidota bacterium]|jgi:uncharacterized protein (TIGR02145 family)